MMTGKLFLYGKVRAALLGGITVALMAWTAVGGTVTWNPAGSGNWADASRWLGEHVPTDGDTVDFNGCTGLVTVADSETLAKIAQVPLTGAGSGLVISNDLAEGDFEFAKPVVGDGGLVKWGTGVTRCTYAEKVEKTGYWMSDGLEVKDVSLITLKAYLKEGLVKSFIVRGNETVYGD